MTARRGQHGFTLIELSIVLLIIAIVARVAIPRLRTIAGAELTASTRRLAGMMRYLYEESALRGIVLQLELDLDRQQYWVTRADDTSGLPIEDTDILARRVTLPAEVRIADVFVPGIGKVAQGIVPARFYPEGFADRAVIHLVDDAGHAYTVEVDPVRGRGVVVEGYHDGETTS